MDICERIDFALAIRSYCNKLKIMIINSAKELGTLVRSERKKRGWSQKELAGQVGVSPLWISNFERGKSTAHIGLVLRTLKTLSVKLHVGDERPNNLAATSTADLNRLFANLDTKSHE